MAEDKRARLSEEAKMFNAKVDEFIALVEDGTYEVPTDYNLMRFLDIKTKQLRYYREKSDQHGYRDGFDKLKMFREDFWVKKSLDKATQTSAIFQLKQPMNGGYMDKQERSTDPIEVKISINGCENAFK